MIVAASLTLGAAASIIAIIACIKGRIDAGDRRWALDGWMRAKAKFEEAWGQWMDDRAHWVEQTIALEAERDAARAEAAALRQKLTRKPAARAQVQAMRVARTNELASGPVAQLGERAA